jgi:hypothetical protein
MRALDDLDALRPGVVQQQPVEVAAVHLPGIDLRAEVAGPVHAPILGAPPEQAAPLDLEAVTGDRGSGPGQFQYRTARRSERLADVIAREGLALEETDPQARPGEQRRSGAAGRATPYDQHSLAHVPDPSA